MFDSCLIHVTFLPSHLSSSLDLLFGPGLLRALAYCVTVLWDLILVLNLILVGGY